MTNKLVTQFAINYSGPIGGVNSSPESVPANELERILTLNDLANDLISNQDLEIRLQRAIDKARMLTQADIAFLCLTGKTDKDYTVRIVSGDIALCEKVLKAPIKARQDALPEAEAEGVCALHNPAGQKQEASAFSEALKQLDIRFSISKPLQVEGRHLGFLFAGNQKPVGFTQMEQSLLSLVGNMLAAEIDWKRTEEKHRRLEAVLEQATETIMITDRDGVIQYVNPEFEKTSGYLRREVIGLRPGFLHSGHHDADFYKTIWDTLRAGKVWRGHLLNKRKDGELYELDATFSSIKNDQGEITAYISVRKDITQETSLRKQLYQAQKMEAIGTLAGGIAHDFNNLLMGIQGNVSLLRLETAPIDAVQKRCETIENYIKKGADLTRQLLGVARGGKYQQVPTDLTKLVNASLDMFGRTKKEIQIHPAPATQPCIAEVDPGQMDQVLLNLFVNAWQAMPDGGHLYTKTEIVSVGGLHPDIVGLKEGYHVKISVTDTGIGMTRAVMDRIFDPFFTTKEKSRGTGLGLASAYGIIKNHGGIIRVQSEPDKGTTFEILLPASVKTSPEISKAENNLAQGKETILLVDDESMVMDICSEMLKRLGYHVITAPKGDAAVSIFETGRDEIDLVILDLVMPGMSGREVYDRLSALKPDVKVLLASGYSLNDQAGELISCGAIGFIQKPYSVADLSQAIRQALSKA